MFKPHLFRKKIKKFLVVIDQARCHMPEKFKKAYEDLGGHVIYIPANMTGEFKN